MKYLKIQMKDNIINDHPLTNKYSFITTDSDVERNICLLDTNIN
jgi:hypothetical protein